MTKKVKLTPISNIIIAKIPKITLEDFKTKSGLIVADEMQSIDQMEVRYERSQNIAEIVAFGDDAKKLFNAKDAAKIKVGAKILINDCAYKLITSGDTARKTIMMKILGVDKLFEDEDKYHYIYFVSKDLFGFWE